MEMMLLVNNIPIALNFFVAEILYKTLIGALAALKRTEAIESLQVSVREGQVGLTLNGAQLPLTPPVNDIIANTLAGIVSSLRGVHQIDSLHIELRSGED